MADTLSAQIAASTQHLIDTTTLLLNTYSPAINTVTKKLIPKGKNAIDLLYVNSTPTVYQPTEGDELVNTSQFSIAAVTVTPVRRTIITRIHRRAENFDKEALIAQISKWLAQGQAIDIDQDIIAQFKNFHTDNSIGTTNVALLLTVLTRGRRLLTANTFANGGPAPDPIFVIVNPVGIENLSADLGTKGVVAATSPWIPAGFSEELIRKWISPNQFNLVGTVIMTDSNLLKGANGAAATDQYAAMYSKEALFFAVSQDWEMKTFEIPTWDGPILRTVADYESGVHGYSHWGCLITAQG